MDAVSEPLVEKGSEGVALDERVFRIEPNRAVLQQAVRAQLANRRQGTVDTKTRGEVAGGGRKMWRQKGTGRARQGSRRAPHWRGGGVVFGPHPRSYRQRLPRKMRRLALRSALSDKAAAGELRVVDSFEVPDGRTKSLMAALAALSVEGRVLLVLHEHDELVRRAARNLADVFVALPTGVSVLDIIKADTVLMTPGAAEKIAALLAPSTPTPVGADVKPAAATEEGEGRGESPQGSADQEPRRRSVRRARGSP